MRDIYSPPQAEARRVCELADRLGDADTVTPKLLSDVIREVCSRISAIPPSKGLLRIERLVQSGAATDAVLALLTLELPQWQVRRITYDEGEWHCAVSCQRELPDWLDQSIEARHANLALSILSAFLDVKRVSTSSASLGAPRSAVVSPLYMPMCCDNFS
jgi:hypothetical protein